MEDENKEDTVPSDEPVEPEVPAEPAE